LPWLALPVLPPKDYLGDPLAAYREGPNPVNRAALRVSGGSTGCFLLGPGAECRALLGSPGSRRNRLQPVALGPGFPLPQQERK